MLTTLVILVGRVAIGLYLLIGAAIAILLWRWWQAQRSLNTSGYELEREMARHRRVNALTSLLLLVELGLIVVGVQQVILPDLEASRAAELIVRDGNFVTPVPPPPLDNLPFEGAIAEVDLTPISVQSQIIVTPVPTPTPVGTILPGAPPAKGCDTPEAQLIIPANGQRINGALLVMGTATTENFTEYRFELMGPGTFDNFVVLTRYNQAVRNTAQLGQFIPTQFEGGSYRFRLTVFDVAGDLRAACEVTIYIAADPTPVPAQ